MTISEKARGDAVARVLLVMLEHVGDDYLLNRPIAVSDPRVADVPPSTWAELKNRYYVERLLMQDQRFALTTGGWTRGLEMRDGEDLRGGVTGHRLDRLNKAIKAIVKADGRQSIDGIPFRPKVDLQGDPDLPVGWVTNALQAYLLMRAYPDREVALHPWGADAFLIPSNFGSRRLDLA